MDIIGINSSAIGCGSLQSYHEETCLGRERVSFWFFFPLEQWCTNVAAHFRIA